MDPVRVHVNKILRTLEKSRDTMRQMHQIEIRDSDDELVTHSPGNIHIERMSTNHWWVRIEVGREVVVVNFHSKSRISSVMERE